MAVITSAFELVTHERIMLPAIPQHTVFPLACLHGPRTSVDLLDDSD